VYFVIPVTIYLKFDNRYVWFQGFPAHLLVQRTSTNAKQTCRVIPRAAPGHTRKHFKLISPIFHFQGWTLTFLLYVRPTVTVDTSILTSSPGQLMSLYVPFVYGTRSNLAMYSALIGKGRSVIDRAPLHHAWSMQLITDTDTGADWHLHLHESTPELSGVRIQPQKHNIKFLLVQRSTQKQYKISKCLDRSTPETKRQYPIHKNEIILNGWLNWVQTYFFYTSGRQWTEQLESPSMDQDSPRVPLPGIY